MVSLRLSFIIQTIKAGDIVAIRRYTREAQNFSNKVNLNYLLKCIKYKVQNYIKKFIIEIKDYFKSCKNSYN